MTKIKIKEKSLKLGVGDWVLCPTYGLHVISQVGYGVIMPISITENDANRNYFDEEKHPKGVEWIEYGGTYRDLGDKCLSELFGEYLKKLEKVNVTIIVE